MKRKANNYTGERASITYIPCPAGQTPGDNVELATLLDTEYDLYHFSEVIQDETFSFDYKLKSGPLYQRNTIRLLEINGFQPAIIREAYRMIEDFFPPTSIRPILWSGSQQMSHFQTVYATY